MWNREIHIFCYEATRFPCNQIAVYISIYMFLALSPLNFENAWNARNAPNTMIGAKLCVCVLVLWSLLLADALLLHWIDIERLWSGGSDLKYARRMVIYLNYWKICREFRQPPMYDMIKCTAFALGWASFVVWLHRRVGAAAGRTRMEQRHEPKEVLEFLDVLWFFFHSFIARRMRCTWKWRNALTQFMPGRE